MELYTGVVEQYLDFAKYAVDDSPCLADWASRIAEDPEVQAWIGELPQAKQQPNLVFAAARWHGVAAPGPYDGLRAALLGDTGEIRTTILGRSTQTNEVGRLATLTPVFSRIQAEGDRPLSLLEVGASAGLCLYPDRFAYRWRTEGGVVRAAPGEPSAGVAPELACDVTGDPPLPSALPEVAWRGGIDLNPLDVRDPDAMAWLQNLVWPEQEERRDRLAAAVEVARREPPTLVRGDLLDELPALVEAAAAHGEVVVFHSAVIAYLEPSDRERFHRMMTGLVTAGACRWVSNEGPNVLPEVTRTGPAVPAEMAAFVLGLDGRAVAWTHPHGRSLSWL
jgi:hypothetical protein